MLLKRPASLGYQLECGFVIRRRRDLSEERPIGSELADAGEAHGVVAETVKSIFQTRGEQGHGVFCVHARRRGADG